MLDVPNLGEKVRIWPFPGRCKIQNGARPIDHLGGGRELAKEGELVKWDEFHLAQLRAGDIMLHEPPDDQAALVKKDEEG